MRIAAIVQGLLPVLMAIGILMFFVPLVDLLYDEPISYFFLYTGLVLASLSFIFYLFISGLVGTIEISYIEALVAYSLIWLLVPAISAIPLSLELGVSYDNALFESISGFTGTGFTVLRGLDYMRKGILFWRGLIQWIGELGVVVFTALVLTSFWQFGRVLYSLERPVRIYATLRETALKIFYMYFLITVIGIVICILLGVEPLDAVVHVMTAISTAGMSNYDANFEGVYRYAPLSIYPITALMIIGGFNFTILSTLLDGKLREAWRNEEFRVYIYLIILYSILSIVILLPVFGLNPEKLFTYGVFNTISALTTTGFSIGNIGTMGASFKMLLITAMLIGGMSNSTSGGFKVVRLVILVKKLKAYLIEFISQGDLKRSINLGEETLEEREVSNIVTYIVIHVAFTLIGAFIIKACMPNVGLEDALFEASSASGNVGHTVGITSPDMPLLAKSVLMLLMYLGKLEYVPLMVLLGLIFYRGTIKLLYE